MNARPAAVTAALVLSLLVAGCRGTSPNEDRPAAPSGPPTLTALELPDSAAPRAERDDRFAPVDLPQLATLGRSWLLATDGRTHLAIAAGPRAIGRERLSLIEEAETAPLAMPRLATALPQQVINGSLNERWVVWQEQPEDTLESSTWTLYAYDRGRGTTRVVTTARDLAHVGDDARVPITPGFATPSLSGDHVYLSAGSVRGREASVFEVDLTTPSAPPRRLTAGRGAFAADDTVTYLTRIDGTIRIAAIDPETGTTTTVADLSPGCTGVTEMAGGHGTMAWIEHCGDASMVTARDHDGHEWTVASPSLGYLNADAGLVSFSQMTDDGEYVQYLLLTATGEILQVDDGFVGGNVDVAEGILTWRTYDRTGRRPTTKVLRCDCP